MSGFLSDEPVNFSTNVRKLLWVSFHVISVQTETEPHQVFSSGSAKLIEDGNPILLDDQESEETNFFGQNAPAKTASADNTSWTAAQKE